MKKPASDTPDRPAVQLFTDGACLGNPGPGGWAYILRHPASGKTSQQAAGVNDTTNNRMELTAVIEGLKALHTPSIIQLVADSQYVLHGIRDWLPGWKKRGWRKADKKPVLNVDLWKALDELLQVHDVQIEWTRGHAGHEENEQCDRLAFAEAQKIKERDEGI